ncbi:MAG TPA: galactokinase [Candidatus Dormibacteraeota bacterium]|nr:galactokinase [Candidatus Dormibacteraeota bacterium]
MSLESMAERSVELFTKCTGKSPRWIVAAPGRVNLIGEHTDYNDGFVLPMALERYTLMAGDRNSDQQVTLHSMTTGESATFPIRTRVQKGEPKWSNYVRGVIAGFQARKRKVAGFDAVIESSVPFGGGLSSSAALEVAAATLLEEMTGERLPPLDKALLCQKAEHDFPGVPCGIMDQFTSILAQADHAILLDCRSRTTEPVPMCDPAITVLLINTNVRHALANGEYAQRRAQCETAARSMGVPALRDASNKDLTKAKLEPIIARRARHVITENERTCEMAQALRAADWEGVSQLMYASHASLRDDYQVSCRELDAVVEIAQAIGEKNGMIGCRMTGGGFGGCAVSLVKTEAVASITKQMDERYEKRTGIQATIFSSRPAAGARVLVS